MSQAFVAIGDAYGVIKINNNDNSSSAMAIIYSFQAHSSLIIWIKPSPFNSNLVATCSEDKSVKVWNVVTFPSFNWTLIRTISNHSWHVEWLDADTLATSSGDATIKIWSLSTGETKRQINAGSNALKLLENKINLAAGVGADINIYNINDGNLVSSLKGHTYGNVLDLVQISADLLASSGSDGTVRIWDLGTNTCKFKFGHDNPVYTLKQVTSNILASADGYRKGYIKLWDTSSGQFIRQFTNDYMGDIFNSLDLIDNGQALVSGGYQLCCGYGDGAIWKWNWTNGELLSTINTGNLGISSLAVINLSSNQEQQQTTTTIQSE
jgi:WD40 repeat protein